MLSLSVAVVSRVVHERERERIKMGIFMLFYQVNSYLKNLHMHTNYDTNGSKCVFSYSVAETAMVLSAVQKNPKVISGNVASEAALTVIVYHHHGTC